MNWQDIELLVTLYNTKNITHAANQLYVSQSTLSSRLHNLEKKYDIPIVLRKRRGITFTPEGVMLAKFAQNMQREHEKMREQLDNLQGAVAGTLRVGVSNFFALNKMPKLLRLFQREHPNVECHVITGWSSEMYRKLLNHDVHVVIIKGDYPWQEGKQLLYQESIVVASPWDFDWVDLPKLPRIEYHTDQTMKQTVDQWWYTKYKQEPFTNIYVNQVETCKEMIVNKLGYGIVTELVVQRNPDLVINPLITKEGELLTRPTWLYYGSDALTLNVVRAFIDFVLKVDVKRF